MPYFESPADGTRLHHVDYGPADGPVVVFVSSTYLGTEMWEYWCSRPRRVTAANDRRVRPARPHPADRLVADIREFMAGE
ncbi:alpha/beta fold hydrolase [Streptomyces sp. NPDC093269]|uniref:alpha/beta fold hydrolase n=1 Tax=unclassified Streptomyces TaxID=2593676 RepID=UPI00381A7592